MLANGFDGSIADFVNYLRNNRTHEYYNRSAVSMVFLINPSINQFINYCNKTFNEQYYNIPQRYIY